MKTFQRILSNLSFAFLAMLLFLLLFQNKVSLPPGVQVIGRMHPLLLHLPIGLWVLAFIFWLCKKNFEEASFRKIFTLILHVLAFATTLTALMGFFLSREGGYEAGLLSKHKLPGVITAVLSYAALLIYQWKPANKFLFSTIMFIALAITLITSHYGANLTHGEGYVWQPLQDEEKIEDEIITDSTTVYVAAIKPVLKAKCFSCHNQKKAKGELVMTNEEKILSGGKNGPIWKPGDAANSRIIEYINLPEDDKKHMPPKGKPQISKEEADFLFLWIQSGADMKKTLAQYSEEDTIKILSKKFIKQPGREAEKIYPFSAASTVEIKKLNSPFCAVFPLAQNSPALQADFFVREKFDREKLKELYKVKEQLVVLNLGNMPVTDDDMKTIGQFTSLEKLILNNASITSRGLEEIKKLKQLRMLSIAGTKVDKSATAIFSQLDSLKEVFVWNSEISAADVKEMKSRFGHIGFNTGYVPDETEMLNLTPPMTKNEEFVLGENDKIELKHQVSGVQIRYTTDGTAPDSTSSPVYGGPITAKGFVVLKARAVKAGWYSSPVADFSFFIKGVRPSSAEYINKPDEKYKGKGITSLFDDKKGPAESYSDEAWLGFREKPFAVLFYFDTVKNINSISLSYNKSVQSYIMPPEAIEIWGGETKERLKLLKKIMPAPIGKEELNTVSAEGIKINIPQSSFRVYKIVVKNVSKLPAWHPGKGDRGWIFIDEIFFN